MSNIKDQIDELKKEISGVEKLINKPGQSEALKKSLSGSLDSMKEKLKKLEEKPAEPAEKKSDAPAKPRVKKKKEEKKDEPEMVTVTAYGETKTFDINDCGQSILAMKYRKQRDKESGSKTKSRLPVTAAVTSAEHTADHIINMIPDKANAEKVIKALQKFEDYWDKAMDSLKEAGISAKNIQKLKDAIDAIQEEVKELKKK